MSDKFNMNHHLASLIYNQLVFSSQNKLKKILILQLFG